MIDTKALRSKVLDLAIQGKLTEQLESDGTAEELFVQIQEEKQKLIKEGKIKKEKPVPPVDGEEIPFEIPKRWKLVRLSEIIKLQSGQDLTRQEYNDKNAGIPYITGASNFNDDGSLIINRWTEIPKSIAESGDILISCKGTVGKITILKNDKVHIARQIMAIRAYCMDNSFIEMYLQSVVNGIKNAQKGLIPGIERNDILSLAFCIPPLAEQKRIVERVEEIFKLLDIIDEAQKKYSDDVEILKSKLITMGIQGKLTEQLESDGTAEELFEQIQEEKQKLIKEGKIKKEKPLPPVSDEEIPFEIPSSWKWVRFGELMRNRDSERIPVSVADRKKLAKIYDYYGASGVIDKVETYLFDKTLLLISEDGANLLSRSIPIAFLANGKYWVNNHAHVLDSYVGDYLTFVMYYINSISLVPYVTGSAQPKLNQDNMSKIPIPLPPLAEQKRIAEKLDMLLSVIGS